MAVISDSDGGVRWQRLHKEDRTQPGTEEEDDRRTQLLEEWRRLRTPVPQQLYRHKVMNNSQHDRASGQHFSGAYSLSVLHGKLVDSILTSRKQPQVYTCTRAFSGWMQQIHMLVSLQSLIHVLCPLIGWRCEKHPSSDRSTENEHPALKYAGYCN